MPVFPNSSFKLTTYMPTVTLSIIPHFEKDSFPGNVFSGRFTSCNDLHPSNDFSYKYNFVLLLSIFTVFKFLLFLKAEIPTNRIWDGIVISVTFADDFGRTDNASLPKSSKTYLSFEIFNSRGTISERPIPTTL